MAKKMEELKAKIGEKVSKIKEIGGKVKGAAIEWAKEHPDEAAGVVCSAVFVGGGWLVKKVGDRRQERKEYIERETRQYDPRTGQYFYTRRPLNSNEKLELEARMEAGEPKGQILKDLRVL